jgi:cytosine/adenosine deaminase-related metal-dependent hydrolase
MIGPGAPADLVAIGLGGLRLAGVPPEDLLAAVVFGGAAADVTDVIVGGRFVVRDGRHVTIDVVRELESALR